jgi:hypothetical protein
MASGDQVAEDVTFIMFWNVAGKFVNPKDITRGS